MKKKEVKIISAYSIKKETVGGYKMEQNIYVYNNGVVGFEDFILYDKGVKPPAEVGLKLSKSMFGREVYIRIYALRFSTLVEVSNIVKKDLIKFGIRLSDLA